MHTNNSFNLKTGTKGTTGTTPSSLTRAREAAGEVMGIGFDSDLEYVPDGETVADGSEPLAPLPCFNQEQGIWPDFIQQIVDKGTTRAQRDILLLGALNLIGCTIGSKARVMYDGKMYSPSMMLFVVAPPASGKGKLALLRHLAQPFHDELRLKWQHEMEEYRKKKLVFDCMGKKRADLPHEEIPVAPVRKFFIIPGNNSGTGMQANIINSDGRGIVFEPEADTISAALNADYGHFDDALRKCFDHEALSFYRRTDDESCEVRSTYVSIVLSGTPAQVARLIPSAENGLFSRFMFYYMPQVQQWQSQFGEKEDLDEWFRRTGLEWKRKIDSLAQVSSFTLELDEAQQDYFDTIMTDIFNRSINASGSEASSLVVRMAHHTLRIMQVVALVRALENGGTTLKPADDIPADNLSDGICQRYTYRIEADDFHHCLMMAPVLFSHATHILSLLPAVEVTNRGSADRERLLSLMPDIFTRKEYLDKAGELNISDNTALQWIKRGLAKGRLLKIDRGTYQLASSRACV